MYKWIMFVLFVGACIVGLAGLAANNKPVEDASAAAPNQLKFTAQNFHFDKTEYHVKKGDKLTVVLNNREGIHGLEIVGYDVKLQDTKLSQEVTFDKTGTFEVHCIVMCGEGHLKMKTTLIVD
jgi:cytochrome c oxidase subunit 2